jgi:hypothetical protein
MTSDRKQPIWPWIAALLIGLPVLYVASFGPACWWRAMTLPDNQSTTVAPRVYWPIGWLAANSPPYSRDGIFWYATRGWRNRVVVPTNWDDTIRFACTAPGL